MRAYIVIAAAAFIIAIGSACAAADAPQPDDLAKIKSCVEKQEAAYKTDESCMEIVARPCIGGDEGSVAPYIIIQCLDREQLAWDSLLNDAFKSLRPHLDSEQQVKLRDMQRAWILSREKSCLFFYDFFQGTMANPMIASCKNKETARRALFLRLFVKDTEVGK
jgi:uncharacterized protein YecT (DUF1311 family)